MYYQEGCMSELVILKGILKVFLEKEVPKLSIEMTQNVPNLLGISNFQPLSDTLLSG